MSRREVTAGLCAVVFLCLTAGCGGGVSGEGSALGPREKIRFQWMQWQHFKKAGISDEQLMERLENVGTTIFADHKFRKERALLAKAHGIRYYQGEATADMQATAKRLKARLAVNRNGLTCPEEFEAYKARGGNVNESGGKYGEHKPAYVPCPLDPRPWDAYMFVPALKRIEEKTLDGIHLDLEPYGAYAFDLTGSMLCYCDDCFGKYLKHKKIDAKVGRKKRYEWLNKQGLIEEYLTGLRDRLIAMFQELAKPLWAIHPTFGFSTYPDFVAEDVRADWRLQGLAMGLNSPDAPFIVINSTPYWQDHTMPWWDSADSAYRKMGIKHVLGSLDGSMTRSWHPEQVVGAAKAMYEFAMASDGFWCWGERVYSTYQWHSFSKVNQMLRQVEAKVGDYVLRGRPVANFVTLVELTGNPLLERALVARTYENNGKHLVIVNNGNADYPVQVRLRFPRLGGKDTLWRLRDPMYDVYHVRDDGTATWDAAALAKGVVAPISGRGELFLLLEPAPAGFKSGRYGSVRSLEIPNYPPRGPEDAKPLPEAKTAAAATDLVYTSDVPGYNSSLIIADLKAGKDRPLFKIKSGFCREPGFSPDRKRVVTAIWYNGQGQIYGSSSLLRNAWQGFLA